MIDETVRNVAAVRAFFDAMNAGDVAGIVNAYAEDGTT